MATGHHARERGAVEFIGYIGGQLGFEIDPETATNILIGIGVGAVLLLVLVTGGRR